MRTLTYVMVEGLPLRGWVGRSIARSAVLLSDILADAPARRDLDPLADSPRTNGSGIDLRKGRLRRRNAAPTARDLPCCLDVPGEGLSKLRGVLVGQVQLVLMRIQSEANGGVGRVTGEVVDEQSRGPLAIQSSVHIPCEIVKWDEWSSRHKLDTVALLRPISEPSAGPSR